MYKYTTFFSWVLAFCFFFAAPLVYGQDVAKDTAGVKQDGGQKPAPADGGGLSADQAVIDAGKATFAANCKQCHAVHEQVVGPALAKVYERRTIPWLINFIKYPQKTIDGGDAYAKALYDKYKQYMPNHDFLKDEEVKAILSYVQAETLAGPAKPAGGGGDTGTASAQPQNSGLLTAIIAGLGGILLLVLGVMALLASVLTRYLKNEKTLSTEDRENLDQKVINWSGILKSQAFIGIVAFIFLAVAAKSGVEGLITVGVQQGYAPEQPIPFSHKLHAGQYEIDCKYCHSSVEKSKNAGIPSLNVCMNCHNTIRTTSDNMKKIYDYIEKDEPIQWVRVHNLPDLAYFNHSQHVKVGGLDCTNCHGNIKEMEVVQQASLLTMGWCIDCHRKTDVNSKGNAYYDKLIQIHGSRTKKPMKVEDIGGLECSKCHY